MSTYVRTGRGGAGNQIPKEEILKQAQQDLEAQTSSANRLAQAELSTPPPGEYKHLGRGGAGNWYTPSELTKTGTTSPEPTDDGDSDAASRPRIRQWTGRGGAGNFAGTEPAPTSQDIELKERERAERVREEVRRGVEESLERPGSAHLGGRSLQE